MRTGPAQAKVDSRRTRKDGELGERVAHARTSGSREIARRESRRVACTPCLRHMTALPPTPTPLSSLCSPLHPPTPPAMSSAFWFPSLPVSEVVDAFTGWGYSVSPEQVARPTSDFVLGVYSACVEQLTGITLDTLQEPIEQALATTDNPVCPMSSALCRQSSCSSRMCTPKHLPTISSCTTCTCPGNRILLSCISILNDA